MIRLIARVLVVAALLLAVGVPLAPVDLRGTAYADGGAD